MYNLRMEVGLCEKKDTIISMMTTFSLQNKALVMVYLVYMVLIPVEHLGIPHSIGILYERIKTGAPIMSILVISLLLVAGFQVLHMLGDYIEVQMYPKLQKFFREYMMISVTNMISYNFKEIDAGDFLTKVVQIPSVIFNHVYEYVGTIIPCSLTLAATIVYLSIYGDFWMSVVLGLVVIGMFFVVARTIESCQELSRERISHFYAVYSAVDDTLHNIKTVMTFDQLQNELDRIDVHQQRYAELSDGVFRCGLKSKCICLPSLMLCAITFLAVLFNRVQNGDLETGTFITISIMITFTVNSAIQILNAVKELITRQGIIDMSFKTFQTCLAPMVPYTVQSRSSAFINIQDMTFKYDGDPVIFENFNLQIVKNEKIAILGHVGSGKSTLISIIMKLQRPQYGDVFIEDVAYTNMSFSDVRSKIGYVPQNPILLDRTILENIQFGLQVNRADVVSIINRVGLVEFMSAFPIGLDTPVGKYGSKISGGQRQVILILKVMLQSPAIVILDESTSAIDENTKKLVDRLLTELMNSRTAIIVTHDSHMLTFADRVITMDHGRIIEDHVRSTNWGSRG